MKKTVLTSARGAYEPPYVEIMEFDVEGGFNLSGTDDDGYDRNDGIEVPGRVDVEDRWY